MQQPYTRRFIRIACIAALAIPLASIQGCATVDTSQKATVSEARTFEEAKALYQKGDYARAGVILKGLADKGDAAAQYALGYLYYYGQGVDQNTDVALDWFRLSAAKGFDKAKEALQRHEVLQKKDNQSSQQPPIINKAPAPTPPPSADASSQKILEKGIGTNNITSSTPDAESAKPDSQTGAAEQSTINKDPLLSRSPSNYTIQLMSGSSETAVKKYIAKYGLEDKATYFPHVVNGRTVYSVIYGDYESRNAALGAMRGLPYTLQKSSPWIRRLSDIQARITKR